MAIGISVETFVFKANDHDNLLTEIFTIQYNAKLCS